MREREVKKKQYMSLTPWWRRWRRSYWPTHYRHTIWPNCSRGNPPWHGGNSPWCDQQRPTRVWSAGHHEGPRCRVEHPGVAGLGRSWVEVRIRHQQPATRSSTQSLHQTKLFTDFNKFLCASENFSGCQ